MFSVVPGVRDSDVSSDSGSELSESSEAATLPTASSSQKCATNIALPLPLVSACSDSGSASSESEGLEEKKCGRECGQPKAPDADEHDEFIPPAGTSSENWQKFQTLQERRTDTEWMKNVLSRGRKRKRRRRRKKVQGTNNTQTSNVTDEVQRSEAEKHGDKEPVDKPASSSGSSASTTQQQQEKHWKNLKKYLDVNDHMKGVDHGKYAPKSGMEKKLDEAVAAGDFEKAEEISDQLSQRDLASRIAKAADARDYMSWKKVQQERKEANRKKKQKLAWGFEPKERWQMKGNM